ncbi:MAG: CapA family protein [bacterium]|nr:CapA family protein [bacterium]
MKKGKQNKLIALLLSLLVAIVVIFGVVNIFSMKEGQNKTSYVKQEATKQPVLGQNVATASPEQRTTPKAEATSSAKPTATPEATNAPQTGDGKEHEASLLAVGDDLIHTQVISSGKRSDGSYNFDHLYQNLKQEISSADIAVVNQETVLGGKSLGYSGYPAFNSPTEVGDALVKAGFDVVLQATNHSMDKGEKGMQNTLDYWKTKKGITVLGANETKKEQDTVKVVEKNGIKIAMLNYTYGLNGLPLPADRKYMVNLLDEKKIKKDVAQAKQISDFVVVFVHWGTEYEYEPDSQQKKYTDVFAEAGVDLVIGSHPHVVEPVKWVTSSNGHKMLVYYSLGNFVSGQSEAPRMLGGLAKVIIHKDADGKTSIKDASITPTVTHFSYSYKTYTVYKLSDYTDKLASEHRLHGKGLTVSKLQSLSKQVFKDWYKK